MNDDGFIDFKRALLRELQEETGISPYFVSSADLVCMVEDRKTHLFDLVIKMETNISAAEVLTLCGKKAGGEYSDFKIIAAHDLDGFVTAEKENVSLASRTILDVLKNQ